MTSSQKTILILLSITFSSGVTPIAIRFTQAEGMPNAIIILIRLWVIILLLLPVVWGHYKEDLLSLTRRQLMLSAVAGFWLALNLLLLFLALEYTSVLITSVLRRTTPLWIIVPEIVLLSAVFSRRFFISLMLSIVGVVLIAIGGASGIDLGSQPLLGMGMAMFGAICVGIYLLIGRKLSKDIPSVLYSWLVFVGGALTATIYVVVQGIPVLGYTPAAYAWTLVVTFMAQVMGHMVINLGLQRFSATAMAIILQVGVAVSAILAAFLFAEIPTIPQVIGSILVVIGVILATIEQNRRETRKAKRIDGA